MPVPVKSFALCICGTATRGGARLRRSPPPARAPRCTACREARPHAPVRAGAPQLRARAARRGTRPLLGRDRYRRSHERELFLAAGVPAAAARPPRLLDCLPQRRPRARPPPRRRQRADLGGHATLWRALRPRPRRRPVLLLRYPERRCRAGLPRLPRGGCDRHRITQLLLRLALVRAPEPERGTHAGR